MLKSCKHGRVLLQEQAESGRIFRIFQGLLRIKIPKRRFAFSMKNIAQNEEGKQSKIKTEICGKG
ncbi:MAG: hypothetical protein B6D34_07895 [Candidatus Brocadia sp. UTAMX1]|nr:MAG: hypothetical protein B6D34_07895 [Candidatus Brocadia sp. UTAMX1]